MVFLLENNEVVKDGEYFDPIPDAWELEFIDVARVSSAFCMWQCMWQCGTGRTQKLQRYARPHHTPGKPSPRMVLLELVRMCLHHPDHKVVNGPSGGYVIFLQNT